MFKEITQDKMLARRDYILSKFNSDSVEDKEIAFAIKFQYQVAIDSMYKSTEDDQSFLNKINKIIDWSATQNGFSLKFVNSVKTAVENGKALTDPQKNAIDNIIKKFKIGVE